MATIPVVENPRRRRRRRLTAKQLAYGFGGKKYRTRKRGRRRNPGLASLAANPRRRRRSGGYSVAHVIRRRRRNPSGGFLGGLGLGGFDLMSAAWVGVGAVGSTMVPGLVRKFWPALPAAGPMGYLVRAGGTFATAYAVKMVTKSPKNFQLVMAGGLGLIFVDLFRQYVAPMVGLSGLGADNGFVMASEVRDALAGYVDTDALSGYVDTDSLNGLGQDDLVPTFVG